MTEYTQIDAATRPHIMIETSGVRGWGMGSVSLQIADQSAIDILKAFLQLEPDLSIDPSLRYSQGDNAVCYSLVRGLNIVGFCVLDWTASCIVVLFIFSPYRRRGLGTQAVLELLKLMRAEGIKEAKLTMTNNSGAFWNKALLGTGSISVLEDNLIVYVS